MAVWWEPTQAELADRNGESPFVLPEFLEESNFQHLYKAHLQTLTAMCSNSKATLWPHNDSNFRQPKDWNSRTSDFTRTHFFRFLFSTGPRLLSGVWRAKTRRCRRSGCFLCFGSECFCAALLDLPEGPDIIGTLRRTEPAHLFAELLRKMILTQSWQVSSRDLQTSSAHICERTNFSSRKSLFDMERVIPCTYIIFSHMFAWSTSKLKLEDYEVTIDHQVEGSGHAALEDNMHRTVPEVKAYC